MGADVSQAGSNNQRVWIVSELYYPELTSTGYFLTGIAEGLAVDYDVSVLCGQPSYRARGTRAPTREICSGVYVRRCRATTLDKNKVALRIVNLVTISLSIFLSALFSLRRGDIVIAVTNPPLLPYVALLACRMRGGRFVLLVHDGQVERRAVSLGTDRGTDVAVLAGLSPGDSLVVTGPENLHDGDKVQVRQ